MCSSQFHAQLTIRKRYHVYHAKKNVMYTPTYITMPHVQLDDLKVTPVLFILHFSSKYFQSTSVFITFQHRTANLEFQNNID